MFQWKHSIRSVTDKVYQIMSKNFTWKQILMRSFLIQSGKLMMKRLPRSSRISSGIEWWRYSCPILNWILLIRTRFSDVVRASFFSFWSNCFVFFVKKIFGHTTFHNKPRQMLFKNFGFQEIAAFSRFCQIRGLGKLITKSFRFVYV